MNKLILINAGWLAMAGITFAVGRMTAKSGDVAGTDAQDTQRSGGLISVTGDKVAGSKLAGAKDAAAGEDFIAKHLLPEQGVLGAEGMTAAMREAMSETDPVKRALMMAQLMQGLTPENVQSALAVLRESPDRRENFQYFALLNFAWGKIDGGAAIANALEEGGRGGAFGAMSVLSGWALTDPDGAKKWIAGQEDGREKMMYMNGLVDGLAKSDPAAATEYVLSMAAPENGEGGFDMRDRYISNIAGEMLKQGVDVASSWADGLPEGSMRASALGEVADYYARQDPSAAASWIESYADSADAERAVEQIADRWARESPEAAANWVAGLPGESQNDAMRSVFSDWAEQAPLEATQYLAAMEASPGRDSAVSGFSREFASEDPNSAMEWAGSIADAEMRQETQISVARQWYRREPEAAQAWATTNLPEESQAAIQQPERGRGGDFGGGRGPGGGRGSGGRGR